jgi:ubiquitin carboxyl-terminal hydrolase 36/42
MAKIDLGNVCSQYLTSRFSKQSNSSGKRALNNEHIANEHKRHTILTQKLLFKPYKKNPLDQLRRRYTNLSVPIEQSNVKHDEQKRPSIERKSSIVDKRLPLMMNWELIKERGSGLINLGNTCFMNASLQCLANTPPLVQWLLSNSHQQSCRMRVEQQFCLFCEAERIVKSIHSKTNFSSSTSSANPNNLVRRIKDISKTFKYGRQEDASEFLICLLDKIVEACLRSSQPPERLRPSSGTSYEQLCHSQTILHDLFALVLRSRVVCSRCHHKSDTFEVQYTWIVGVRNHADLRQSLQQFVCRENLSGENLYRCMKCKQLVPAIKRYTLHKASKVLLINLKRFEFGKNSHKLSHLVRYSEHLNVSPYMSEDDSHEQSLNYRLYAVLVHVGSSMHSGHYYSYVRSPNNRWYKADDTSMTACDLSQVLTQHGAYILCYIQETNMSASTKTSHEYSTAMTNNGTHVNNGRRHDHVDQSTTMNTTKYLTPRAIVTPNLPRQSRSLTCTDQFD